MINLLQRSTISMKNVPEFIWFVTYLPQIVGLNGHNPAANVGAVSSKGFDGHFIQTENQ